MEIFFEKNMFDVPITWPGNCLYTYLFGSLPIAQTADHLPLFFAIYVTNFSQNIHLTLLMMTETPQSQGWWPGGPSKPVCHYCWPVAHFYLPVISRPPWEEVAGSREGKGAKGEWEAEIERQDKQGWRVVGEVRGQQRALGELWGEKIDPSRWMARWKVKEDHDRARCGNGRKGWEAGNDTDGRKWGGWGK